MLESYDTYTYMKKRWEKYVRKQGMENVSWETVLHRIVLFLRPVWNAMCRDEVFFGPMMYKIEGEDLYLIGTSEHSMIGKLPRRPPSP